MYNYSKRKKISLYVNDVEFFKKKEIYIKNKNLIIRKKKSEFSKDSLLSRLAYHDFYLLKKFINLDNMRISILVKKKKYLSFKILSDDKIYRFIYDVNSNFKKHFINQKKQNQ